MPNTHRPPIDKTRKRGVNATKAGRDKRIAALRKSRPSPSTKEAVQNRDPNRPLTEKQKLAVRAWAKGESLRTALVRAGYAEGSVNTLANSFRNDPAILAAYHAQVAKVEKAADFSRKKFMDGLQEAADMAKLIGEPNAMVAAYREMGKACGYYEPTKVLVDVNVRGNVLLQRLNTLTDDQLQKLIEEGHGSALEGEFKRIEEDEDEETSVKALSDRRNERASA